MTAGEDRYHVLLEEAADVDPRLVAELVAAFKGVTPLQARAMVRRGGGVVGEDLPEEHAVRLHERLASAGVAVRVVLASSLPALPEVERAAEAEAGEEDLRLRTLEGAALTLLWDQLMLANAGLVFDGGYVDRGRLPPESIPGLHAMSEEDAAVVRENMILRMKREAPRARKGSATVLEHLEAGKVARMLPVLDLMGAEASCWVRVLGRTLVFRSGRLRMAGELAFAKLVRRVAERCPETRLGPLTLKMLRTDDIKGVTVAGLQEMGQLTRWQTFLKLTDVTE